MGEGDAGRDRDHTTDSQRDPQAPIHLSGASIGHERDNRARRDKGEPKALAFDLADAEEGGQGRRHDQCSANPNSPDTMPPTIPSGLAESRRLKPALRSVARMRAENAWLRNPQYWALQE